MCLIYFLMKPLGVPLLTGFLLVVGELFLTGGTLADGLMDSSDGLFSGRSKERCLEIMKDSLIGSFGMLSILIFVRRMQPRRILDVATGTGDLALAMARRMRGVQVLGVDLSENMLAEARRKATACGLDERVVSSLVKMTAR